MPRLPLLGALAMAFLLSAAGPARAGEVRLSKLSGVPASAALGDRFTPSGEVRLRGSGSPRVRLRAVLVGEDRSVAVGRKVLRRVRRDRPRRFRVPSVVPARGVPAGDYRVRVCARSRGREARCARTPMRVLVAYGAPTPTPAVTGTPEPTASATPTAGATATATVTATATATATPPVGTSTALPCPPMDAPRPVALPATLAARADGSESLGDPLFPNLGNGGYDVRSYDLALSYTPGLPLTAGTLAGTATIVAEATAPLDRFSLDLFGFTVSEVTVNGQPATASRVQDPGPYGAKKLRIAPTAQIPSGSTFTTVVTYSGQPPTVTDPDDSSEGFLPTSDGAFVVGEPMGSMGWFPNNNHPTDKATFKLAMTVPSTHTVVGNGDLVSSATNGPTRTWVWHEGNPMATYLATATLGIFNVTPTTDSKGLPYYDALDPAAGPASGVAIQKTAMDLFRGCFGDYPFSIYGSIVDFAPDVGYALETQTKPVYPSGLAANASTVSHELAHQWYGNSVSPATWRDIWLNEGFAEWGSWLYEESTAGGTTTAERFASLYAANPEGDSFWTVPPAAPPTGAELFNTDAMYDRGAMTLEALRQIHGNAVYYAVLRTWHSQFKYSTATTAQFIALVKQLSDKPDARLDAFFDDWLYDADRPAITPTNFDAP